MIFFINSICLFFWLRTSSIDLCFSFKSNFSLFVSRATKRKGPEGTIPIVRFWDEKSNLVSFIVFLEQNCLWYTQISLRSLLKYNKLKINYKNAGFVKVSLDFVIDLFRKGMNMAFCGLVRSKCACKPIFQIIDVLENTPFSKMCNYGYDVRYQDLFSHNSTTHNKIIRSISAAKGGPLNNQGYLKS